ncbi:MAG: class I SAM-dependent rRNA methyltransferase [Spirochaetota bacterium]
MNQLKKIVLKESGKFRPPHPWIYRNSISYVDPGIKAGDIAAIVKYNGIFLGIGYYNPKSVIAVRLLSDIDEPINKQFFIDRISIAFAKREPIKKISNAFRIISSEADGLPGLIADIYNDTIVFQISTLGMEHFKQDIISAMHDVIKPVYIYEKSDSSGRAIEGLKPESGWHGAKGNGIVEIYENNAVFIIDIVHGHKTGFYLDQRKARLAAGNFAKGRNVLDVFCYTGGFAIHCALKKAVHVTCIDTKNDWLLNVRKNSEKNNVSDVIECIKGDAFNILHKYWQDKVFFDMIILDPPSFVKTRHALKTAVKGYLDLNRSAMRLLTGKGILCTFSCSHHITGDIFFDMLKKAAELENKILSVLKRCHQDKDHPIIKGIPESEYLKGYFFSVESKNEK